MTLATPEEVEYSQWLEEELIPLLIEAYGYDSQYWYQAAKDAEKKLHYLPIHESFQSTVERIRLLLINKEVLTRAEIQDFGWLRDKADWCVGVLVRHAMHHGAYPLATLGKEPNRDLARRKSLGPDEQDSYMYGGKLAVRSDVGLEKIKGEKRPNTDR
ncbi:hypothetical protein ACEQ8H_005776 [Pleosporales sp. CAS-2024a]